MIDINVLTPFISNNYKYTYIYKISKYNEFIYNSIHSYKAYI